MDFIEDVCTDVYFISVDFYYVCMNKSCGVVISFDTNQSHNMEKYLHKMPILFKKVLKKKKQFTSQHMHVPI